ncbi:MAG: carbohydrate-binding family 9-like protein [Coriobacteriia bacterium]|nr:carbohydrate-binding family 9-like protein [Coriobacteriia bacterium]
MKHTVGNVLAALVLMCGLSLAGCAGQGTPAAAPENAPSNGTTPAAPASAKTYQVTRCASLDAIAWDAVPAAHIDVNRWNSPVTYPSWAKVVFVEGYGFVARLECEQANPWTECLQDGDPVYHDSALELFISLDRKDYLNVETNALGVSLQQFGPSRQQRQELSHAQGTAFTVEAQREADRWWVTIYLPQEGLARLWPNFDFASLSAGAILYANFYKTGKDPATGQSHYQTWNDVPTEKPDFHQPTYFGTLVLG